jgi:hypothetical protein
MLLLHDLDEFLERPHLGGYTIEREDEGGLARE